MQVLEGKVALMVKKDWLVSKIWMENSLTSLIALNKALMVLMGLLVKEDSMAMTM